MRLSPERAVWLLWVIAVIAFVLGFFGMGPFAEPADLDLGAVLAMPESDLYREMCYPGSYAVYRGCGCYRDGAPIRYAGESESWTCEPGGTLSVP